MLDTTKKLIVKTTLNEYLILKSNFLDNIKLFIVEVEKKIIFGKLERILPIDQIPLNDRLRTFVVSGGIEAASRKLFFEELIPVSVDGRFLNKLTKQMFESTGVLVDTDNVDMTTVIALQLALNKLLTVLIELLEQLSNLDSKLEAIAPGLRQLILELVLTLNFILTETISVSERNKKFIQDNANIKEKMFLLVSKIKQYFFR